MYALWTYVMVVLSRLISTKFLLLTMLGFELITNYTQGS